MFFEGNETAVMRYIMVILPLVLAQNRLREAITFGTGFRTVVRPTGEHLRVSPSLVILFILNTAVLCSWLYLMKPPQTTTTISLKTDITWAVTTLSATYLARKYLHSR